MKSIRINTLLFFLTIPFIIAAQYSITGQLKNANQEYSTAMLEYVPNSDNLNATDANNIIKTVQIDSLGRFKISGIDLIEEKSLYRLSLNERGDIIGISIGISKNHILLALDNSSHVQISDCQDVSISFENCTITGDSESVVIQQVYEQIWKPVLMEYKEESGRVSDRREMFIKDKLISDYKKFADTTQHMLAGLVALASIGNLEEEYKIDPEYYHNFISKWQKTNKESSYLNYFMKKIDLYKAIHFEDAAKKSSLSWITYLLGFMLLAAIGYILHLRRQLQRKQQKDTKETSFNFDLLSKKEKEAAQLMVQGLSNKEIASSLFIETNTVKSHVTKIFQKLNIHSRQELLKANKIGD